MKSNISTEEIKRLWNEAFSDEEAVTSLFLKHFYATGRMLTIEDCGSLLSMLHIIPFTFNGQKIGYIYAVATTESARGKGYATELINSAIKLAKETGYAALALIPADDGLQKFYSRFGFKGSYKVVFDAPHSFDFGTGNKEKDRLSILQLDNSLKASFSENECPIRLEYNG